MTQEQQRINIAEACGLKPTLFRGAVVDEITLNDTIPDYLNDLNAMAQAEKTIKGGETWRLYKDGLAMICMTGFEYPVDATAAQKAEIFLRTLGLWTP